MGAYEISQRMLEKIKRGHPQCSIKLTERVEKVIGETKDIHLENTRGVVVGSILVSPGNVRTEAYLVRFDGDAVDTFIIGSKIRKI